MSDAGSRSRVRLVTTLLVLLVVISTVACAFVLAASMLLGSVKLLGVSGFLFIVAFVAQASAIALPDGGKDDAE